MAYHFKQDESIRHGVKRIARKELGAAIACLRGRNGVRSENAVHEARKSIKKVRALMRLVQSELGDSYTAENAALRESGRRLSELRDAAALIRTFDDFKRGPGKGLRDRSAAEARRALVLRKKLIEAEAEAGGFLHESASSLSDARKRVKEWPLGNLGASAAKEGLEKTFRRGRKAMALAKSSARREDFHEWRKRVKDLWYQVRLLKCLRSGAIKGQRKTLKELEGALGDDLNLALLQERITASPESFGRDRDVEAIVRSIADVRKELRAKALETGDRIYNQKPRRWRKKL